METLLLDLMAQRCPMALLLAKRTCAALHPEQRVEIRLSDSGARRDIPRFLHHHGYTIDILQDDNTQLVMIVKKGTFSSC